MKNTRSFALMCAAALTAITLTTTSCNKDDNTTYTYSVSTSGTELDFGSLVEGYESPAILPAIIIANTGTGTLEMYTSELTFYATGEDWPAVIKPGEQAVFCPKPKQGFSAGVYDEHILISFSKGIEPISILAKLTVTPALPSTPITISDQKNAMPVGIGGMIEYEISVTDIDLSDILDFIVNSRIDWYPTAEGATPVSQPAGVILYVHREISSSEIALEISVNKTIAAGDYYFTVTYKGVTSNRAKLTVTPPLPSATITLSGQKGPITVGTGGYAGYDFSATDIEMGGAYGFLTYAEIKWYATAQATTSMPQPNGIDSYQFRQDPDLKGLFVVVVNAAMPVGDYYFTVTYKGVTSNRAKLTVGQ